MNLTTLAKWVLGIVLTFGAFYGVDALVTKHEDKVFSQMQQQNATLQKTLTEEINLLIAQNAALQKSLDARQVVETNIPTQIGSMKPPEVAQQISDFTLHHPVVPTASGGVTLDEETAKAVAEAVTLLPLLEQDKKDLTQQVQNETKMFNDEVAKHLSDNNTNAEAIKDIKKKAFKEKLKIGAICYGAGVVTGVTLHYVFHLP
jgi:hypothetical protein